MEHSKIILYFFYIILPTVYRIQNNKMHYILAKYMNNIVAGLKTKLFSFLGVY